MGSKVKKHLILLFLCVFLVSLIPDVSVFATPSGLKVSVEYGFQNTASSGHYVPFRIMVENTGSDFEGTVRLLYFGREDDVIGVDRNISVSSGTAKTVNFTIPMYNTDYVRLLIEDKKGRDVYGDDIKINLISNDTYFTIGVLSDDLNALGYLSGKYMTGFPSIQTRLFKLDAASFPTDANALDMIDCFLISNFSTDSLSNEQISALLDRISNGALLVLGTGDTAVKTMSGLSKAVNLNAGDLKNVETSFGVNSVSYTYQYTDKYRSGSYYSFNENLASIVLASVNMEDYIPGSPQEVYEFVKYEETYDTCEKIYTAETDLFKKTFWTEFFGESYDATKVHSSANLADYENDFRTYCVYDVIPQILNIYADNLIMSETLVPSEMPIVTSNILPINYGSTLISGDIKDSDGSYPFASYNPFGNGNIAVFAVDLTKAPFVTYPANYNLVVHVMEVLSGETLQNKAYGGMYYSYDYNIRNLVGNITALSPVPVLLYVLILFGYTVVAFVLFFRLRKKGKAAKIWSTQAILAVAASLLVIALSFTTRLFTPKTTSVSIVTDVSGAVTKNTYAACLFPKTKTYTVDFESSYYPTLFYDGSRYSYNYYLGSPFTDAIRPDIIFRDDPQVNRVSVRSGTALTPKYFKLSDKNFDYSSKIDFHASYYDGKLTGTLTNNTDKTLEHCVVFVDLAYFALPDVYPGDTLDLSSIPATCLIDPERSEDDFIAVKDTEDLLFPDTGRVANIIFGTNGRSFKQEFYRHALWTYARDAYLSDYRGINIYNLTYNYNSYNVFGTSVRGIYVSDLVSSTEDLYAAAGLDANGLPVSSDRPPFLVAFSSDPDKVLKNGREDGYMMYLKQSE